jgi:hypothetical protein
MRITGKVSHFGGPSDTGVSPSEDLAWWEDWDGVIDDHAENLFMPHQPPNTTGLARRLNPNKFYIAMRWDYDQFSKDHLATSGDRALVRAANGRQFLARPADWGPNENTGRIADISPGLMTALGLETDDEVTVTYPADVAVELPPWSPRPRVVVDLGIPDGVELVLMINGVQLMPEEGDG